jgi:DNA-binding MarR family transcriptional regulator
MTENLAPRVDPNDIAPVIPLHVHGDLPRLMTAFRTLQMHHAHVLNHQSIKHGLNATDVRFVFFLDASDGSGVTPKQAGEYLELSTGAMTSLVDRMVDRGHLERRPNPDDRRSVLLHLTPSGESVAQEIGAVYTSAFRETIDPADQSALADAFERVGVALRRGRTD